jgi:hypothetical protein
MTLRGRKGRHDRDHGVLLDSAGRELQDKISRAAWVAGRPGGGDARQRPIPSRAFRQLPKNAATIRIIFAVPDARPARVSSFQFISEVAINC